MLTLEAELEKAGQTLTDLDIEVWIRKAEGKIPSRRLILMEFEREELPTFDDEPEGAGYPFQEVPKPSFEVIETLVNWAKTQPEDIREMVWSFMDNPEEQLVPVLEKLLEKKVITKDGYNRALCNPQSNFTELLRRQFRKHKVLDWDYLKDLSLREMAQAERPTKALQESLKLLLAEKLIVYEGNGVYRCTS